jgi:arginyl-tRNA--protein-N-Asp/Glu arginylyltransferase
MRPLTRADLAHRLAAGDRRQGHLLYRPACPRCGACEAIRVDVDAFVPTRTQKRILRRGNAELDVEVGRPSLTPEKLALYNRHKIERNLVVSDEPMDSFGYEQFLVDTCTDTIELAYRRAGELVAVAVADRAEGALSAVYTFFNPDYGRLSPGAYSILKQIELCRAWRLPYLYLGLYVADCAALRYKASYLPHERRIDGVWRRFERT